MLLGKIQLKRQILLHVPPVILQKAQVAVALLYQDFGEPALAILWERFSYDVACVVVQFRGEAGPCRGFFQTKQLRIQNVTKIRRQQGP